LATQTFWVLLYEYAIWVYLKSLNGSRACRVVTRGAKGAQFPVRRITAGGRNVLTTSQAVP